MSSLKSSYDYVIIGGGVSGVICAQTLSSHAPESSIAIFSVSPVLKSAIVSSQASDHIINFNIKEKTFDDIHSVYSNIDTFCANVYKVDSQGHSLDTSLGEIKYKKLLVATGGKPKRPFDSPYVVGLRDIDSLFYLSSMLKDAQKVVVYGNGGVAIDFINTITTVDIVWIYKHDYIGHTFLDKEASLFLSPYMLNHKESEIATEENTYVYNTYSNRNIAVTEEEKINQDSTQTESKSSNYSGAGIGPCWHKTFLQLHDNQGKESHPILKEDCSMIEAYCEKGGAWYTLDHQPYTKPVDLQAVEPKKDNSPWNLYILLTNGKIYGCDFLLTAIGVDPNIEFIKEDEHYARYKRTTNNELIVDEHMKVQGVEDIYAAGDVSKVEFSTPALVNKPRVWFQMKLWSQAYLLGKEAALNMLTEEDLLEKGICYDIFAHCTHIFGFKVILLGLYNGQNLPIEIQRAVEEVSSGTIDDEKNDIHIDILRRIVPGQEMIKLVVLNDRVVGAILIGETDLEEAIENIILNRFYVGDMKGYLLDPEFNLEDYFD